jgi:hypothetical protein
MLSPMDDASWVPATVESLVPPARLGALMVECRSAQGLEIADMAERSNGLFTQNYLEEAERGGLTLDGGLIGQLAGLYEVDAGPVVPLRSELILDLDRQELKVGDTAMSFNSIHVEDVLQRYVSLVYKLRGQQPGSGLVLRDRDLGVLSASLGYNEPELRRKLYGMMAAPDSVQQAKAVGRGRMLAAVGLLAGITAIGTLVLVGASSDDAPTEVLGEERTLITAGFPKMLGLAAETSIDFDFRAALPDWEIEYGEDHPDLLGVTRSEDKAILIYVEPAASAEVVAAVLMHEVGHAIDLERLTDDQRAEWIALRGMPSIWWPGNGLNDFAVGAGDFAEAVSALTTGSPSSSVYGEFTDEQLAYVDAILSGV